MQKNNYEIRIEVATNYVVDQSEPDVGRYVFAYTITIENLSMNCDMVMGVQHESLRTIPTENV